MKNMKKILASLAGFVMAAGLSAGNAVPVEAADATVDTNASVSEGATITIGTENADKSITVTTPSGLKDSDDVTYTVYRVFNATANGTAVSYKKISTTQSLPYVSSDRLSKLDVDAAGNVHYYNKTESTASDWNEDPSDVTALPADLVSVLANKVNEFTNLGSVTIHGGNKKATIDVKDYGYYFVTTTTGTAVAINTTNKSAEITDKNSVPTVDKTIISVNDSNTETTNTKGSVSTDGKNAIGEVGSTVHYQSIIHVGKGAQKYILKDKMSSGLKFDSTSVKVQSKVGSGTLTDITNTQGETAKYTVTEASGSETGYTFQIEFDDTFMKGLSDQITNETGVDLYVTYTAKVTKDILTTTPETNSATISYGNDSKYTSEPSTTNVYGAKITVIKHTENGSGLAGAGFILSKNDNGTTKYYKYHAATTTANAYIEWVTNKSNADQFYSAEDGNLYVEKNTIKGTDNKIYVKNDQGAGFTTEATPATFKGLQDGTYKLVEETVPAGYNRIDDNDSSLTVKIKAANSTGSNVFEAGNLEPTATVVNNSGHLLPSTGGIGTTIFYIAGGILIIGAAVLLINRKKKANA